MPATSISMASLSAPAPSLEAESQPVLSGASLASLATDIAPPEFSPPPISNITTSPALEPSAYYIKEGSNMTARATGFAPYEQVQLSRGTKMLGAATATGGGSAEFAFIAPLLGVTFEITAVGLESGAKASRIITLAQ
ncbi:hypothetical protein A2852_00180 [Candidatus Adlerbacteria bacterium RIFCSPHIGHO2_01_FULL_54_23]|nr:MAG: hypothetical protein A2852_00180 [Candidatus Adlerbacteria bacterium RIFCSPHIGHO2_01_FULL_54_23]